MNNQQIIEERLKIEQQFQELIDKANDLYPNIQDSISISKTFNASNNEINEYINLLNQPPQQISTNLFIIS